MANAFTVKDVRVPGGDLLQGIFQGQKDLMEKYHVIEARNHATVIMPTRYGNLDARDVQTRLKHLAYCVIEEIAEATACLKNKPWKSTTMVTDSDHFYEELADALHFFVELCITAGLDADDLATLYHRKHAVNQMRQRSGY